MKTLLAAALIIALAGCSTDSRGEPLSLPTTGRVDYQLGGAYAPPKDVTIVARDSTDPPLEGVYSICYLNGFQTQPQQADFWLNEHPDLVLRDKRRISNRSPHPTPHSRARTSDLSY